MIIASDCFENAKIVIEMLPDSDGQWQVTINFENDIFKYSGIPKETIKNVFGFNRDAGDTTDPTFFWNSYLVDKHTSGSFEISFTFLNQYVYGNYSLFRLIHWICDSIKKLNEEIFSRNEKNDKGEIKC